MSKFKDLYRKIVSTKATEIVKTGAESAKTLVELTKSIAENKAAIPAIGGASLLLSWFGAPLGIVIAQTIQLAPLVLTILKQFEYELTLEECVTLIVQAAYLESWQAELKQQPDWLWAVDLDRSSTKIDRKLNVLGEVEITSTGATVMLSGLPSSELVGKFNEILTTRLEDLGVDTFEAQLISARVAQNAPRYLPKLLAESAKKNRNFGRVL
jgi:hypothetical protein